MKCPSSVSVSWLKEHDACSDQVDLFERTFGNSVTITRDVVLKAGEVGLNLDWFAENALDAPAQKIYYAARADAQKIYYAAIADAQKIFDASIAPAQKIFDAAIVDAQKIFDAARAPALNIALGFVEDSADAPART